MNYSARQLPTDHILHPSRENMPPTKLNKPFDSRLYNNILIRAKEYYDKNQLQLSIEYFTKVLQYEPYSLWINYHLAVAYLATNNFSIGLNCV